MNIQPLERKGNRLDNSFALPAAYVTVVASFAQRTLPEKAKKVVAYYMADFNVYMFLKDITDVVHDGGCLDLNREMTNRMIVALDVSILGVLNSVGICLDTYWLDKRPAYDKREFIIEWLEKVWGRELAVRVMNFYKLIAECCEEKNNG